ncbi:PAP2 superfamily protein [Maioricimonas rarisocia]|uniref:PAP2 superfamily protein n=2 Tax=Maioricimonas rarisocia TaxID=2528026 RepID=A0A517ZD63_9PLAN|nr:PAP2 superfamily protein [Maioricimonas rarisocia]
MPLSGCATGAKHSVSRPQVAAAPTDRQILPVAAHGAQPRPHASFREAAREELRTFLPRLRDDAAVMVEPHNLVLGSAMLAASIGIRQGLDSDVRSKTAEHPDRWGEASSTLGHFGEVQYQLPVIAGVWATGLWTGDESLQDFNRSLINAYTLTGLSTLVIKGIADTDRPDPDWNNGRFGFPSFHVASTFAIAATVEEYYGWKAGLPAYTLAGLIGYSRIDERDHDLSDVVFGAGLGWIIGKAVAGKHLDGDGRVRLVPFIHPDASAALGIEIEF